MQLLPALCLSPPRRILESTCTYLVHVRTIYVGYKAQSTDCQHQPCSRAAWIYQFHTNPDNIAQAKRQSPHRSLHYMPVCLVLFFVFFSGHDDIRGVAQTGRESNAIIQAGLCRGEMTTRILLFSRPRRVQSVTTMLSLRVGLASQSVNVQTTVCRVCTTCTADLHFCRHSCPAADLLPPAFPASPCRFRHFVLFSVSFAAGRCPLLWAPTTHTVAQVGAASKRPVPGHRPIECAESISLPFLAPRINVSRAAPARVAAADIAKATGRLVRPTDLQCPELLPVVARWVKWDVSP